MFWNLAFPIQSVFPNIAKDQAMSYEKEVKYLGAVQKGAAPPADYQKSVKKMNKNSSSNITYFLKRKDSDRMNHYSVYVRWTEDTVSDFVSRFNEEKRIA